MVSYVYENTATIAVFFAPIMQNVFQDDFRNIANQRCLTGQLKEHQLPGKTKPIYCQKMHGVIRISIRMNVDTSRKHKW